MAETRTCNNCTEIIRWGEKNEKFWCRLGKLSTGNNNSSWVGGCFPGCRDHKFAHEIDRVFTDDLIRRMNEMKTYISTFTDELGKMRKEIRNIRLEIKGKVKNGKANL